MALTDSVLIFSPRHRCTDSGWDCMETGGVRRWIWAFYIGNGSRHADEGTGRVRRAHHRSGTLTSPDAPVAGLLAEGGSSCGHAAVHSACRTLVCGHVPRAWRRLCHRREGPYDRPIPQSDGRTPGHHLLLSPGPALRLLPLERAPSCPALSHAQRLVPHTSCSLLIQIPTGTSETRPLCRPMGWWASSYSSRPLQTRLPHYIGPLFPAAALLTASYWSRCLQDPTTKGIRGSIHLMMGAGVSLGDRLCLPPYALRNLCLQDGAGVPLGRTGGSRQRSLSGCEPCCYSG